MAAKVLIVDDERDAVEMIRCNLKAAGYEVLVAGDGMEALYQARKHLPDVILLDLMLPDLDGFSVCEILRCQPSTAGIPVIVLTAMAGEMPRLHGLEVGATDYCVKPVRMRDLMGRVDVLIAAGAARVGRIEQEKPLTPSALAS